MSTKYNVNILRALFKPSILYKFSTINLSFDLFFSTSSDEQFEWNRMRPENSSSSSSLQCFMVSSIFFFTVFPRTHCSNHQPQNSTACQPSFACGILNEISYPFWTNGQSHCGQQGFELLCHPNRYPVIYINNQRFLVLEIEQDNQRLKLERTDFWSGTCPLSNTSLDLTVFSYHSKRIRNINIFYGCTHQEVTPLAYRSKCTTDDGIIYDILALLSDTFSICDFQVTIPILRTASNQLMNGTLTLQEAINEGFIADYNYDEQQFCKLCRDSAGKCVLHVNPTRLFCVCQGKSQERPCSANSMLLNFLGSINKV